MNLFRDSLRLLGLLLVSFVLTLTLAQTPLASPLVGTWQTSIELGQGVPASGIFRAQPDGTYREELYAQNQLVGFWEGTYTLAPDGTLTQTETGKSPQLCLQGQCMANEGPATSLSRVSVQGPDTFTVTGQDPASGQTFTLTWQRAGGANPNVQTPSTPTQMPTQMPSAQLPSAPGQAGQSPIVGSWQLAERTQQGHTVVTVFTYTADGRFNVKTLLNGQSLMSSYGGTYSLSPDGTYYENTTEKSDQYCYLYCQPNSVQLGNAGPFNVSFPDTNTLTFSDGRGSYSVTRAQPGSMPGSVPTPGAATAMPGGTLPNTGVPSAGYTAPGSTGQGDFIDGVIWGESSYVGPDGSTFNLPVVPDPDMTYTSPSGNDLSYNDVTGTWTETDAYGFETEVEPSE